MQYSNLIGEIAKRKIKKHVIARELNIHTNSFRNKLYGKTLFSVDEAIQIQEKFFPDLEIKYLFGRDEGGE